MGPIVAMAGAITVAVVSGMVRVVFVTVVVAVVAVAVVTARSMIAVVLGERGQSDVEGGGERGERDSVFHTTVPVNVKMSVIEETKVEAGSYHETRAVTG